MYITTLHTTTNYKVITEIAEALGYSVEKDKEVGSPYLPVLSVTGNRVHIGNGHNSKHSKTKKAEGYIQVSEFEFIKQLIINRNTNKKNK